MSIDHVLAVVPVADFEAAEKRLDERTAELKALEERGIDLAAITRELEEDGVAKFAASYRSLLAGIEAKAGELVGR